MTRYQQEQRVKKRENDKHRAEYNMMSFDKSGKQRHHEQKCDEA